MIKVNLKTDVARDVLVCMFLSEVDKDSLLSHFYAPIEFSAQYDHEILEEESGQQDDWEEYDGSSREAWCVTKFTSKSDPSKVCVIKFYGYHQSHDGTYLQGIKEVNRVVKTIETWE